MPTRAVSAVGSRDIPLVPDLVGYLLPVPAVIATIDWVVLAIGVVLLILVQVGRPVGGRRYWY